MDLRLLTYRQATVCIPRHNVLCFSSILCDEVLPLCFVWREGAKYFFDLKINDIFNGSPDFSGVMGRTIQPQLLVCSVTLGEKPHKCEQCDFTCRDVSYLSKHMLTHCDDKNYMCTECGYVTKWKHYLNVHMRKHTGDLRYRVLLLRLVLEIKL